MQILRNVEAVTSHMPIARQMENAMFVKDVEKSMSGIVS